MASSTRCSARPAPRAALLAAALLAILSWIAPARGAEPSIDIRSAEITADAAGHYLDATFDIELGAKLEEALARGVALNFAMEFELYLERWYTLKLWNKTLSEFEQRFRVSYNALTRQYSVSSGALSRNVDTLEEALALIGRVRHLRIATAGALRPGTTYAAQLRLRLDSSQLPKPFQINAIGSKGWNLSSDWYRWTVRP